MRPARDERAVKPRADDVPDGRVRAPGVRIRELGRDDADTRGEVRRRDLGTGAGEEGEVGGAALGV